jgi:putative nucleotidyltransferase with HDIG domain
MGALGASPQGALAGGTVGLDAARLIADGLDAALRARAAAVHASTAMVTELATRVSREYGLEGGHTLVELSARLRDVGMLSLPDALVLETGPLPPADWELINTHPARGAELLETLEPLAAIAPIVRSHHERWDGGGYPDGLRADDIPLASRVISVCDAFVSMARDRPHRKGLGIEVALERVVDESGRQFDAEAVDALVAIVAGRATRRPQRPESRFARPPAPATEGEAKNLQVAILELDMVPVSALAHQRVMDALATGGSELVSAIESDIGLTVATLRRAQDAKARRPVASVPDAVAVLEASDIDEATRDLPQAHFPWRTALDARLHRLRAHAQSVSRAAERIARELDRKDVDEILAAALLHDVGKLVLARARSDYEAALDPRTQSPEARAHAEHLTFAIDHASLGGLLLSRWGLPSTLEKAVAGHHTAASGDDPATLIRLADQVARHAQGDRIDQRVMLELAAACGLSVASLREVLFDLPRAGGSQKRRAEPSPLSDREETVLRGLSEGKGSKTIAAELGISASTVRSFLNTLYKKLAVNDRAQAVLKATEMGWI